MGTRNLAQTGAEHCRERSSDGYGPIVIVAKLAVTITSISTRESLFLRWTLEGPPRGLGRRRYSGKRHYDETILFYRTEASSKDSWRQIRAIGRACGVDTSPLVEFKYGARLAMVAAALNGKRAEILLSDDDGPPTYRPAPPAESTIANLARTVGHNGVRLGTGFESLDRASGGGFPFGKIVAVGAAPSCFKTMLAVTLAHRWAMSGVPVVFLAADGGIDDVVIRLGQRMGFARASLESGDMRTRDDYAQQMAAAHLPLHVDEEIAIEAASARLDDLCRDRGARGGVLIVDSIQLARTELDEEHTRDLRQCVEAAMFALRQIRRRGHLVIVTSEVPRSHYGRSRLDPLAAFKESGSVEYGADVAIVLLPPDDADEPDTVVVKVTRKNRLGSECPTFRLRLDRESATLDEASPRAQSKKIEAKAPFDTPIIRDVRAALKCLGPGPYTLSRIRKAVNEVRGKSGRADAGAVGRAMKTLCANREVEVNASARGAPSYMVGGWSAGRLAVGPLI